jgi:hypothetical protein
VYYFKFGKNLLFLLEALKKKITYIKNLSIVNNGKPIPVNQKAKGTS